MSENLLARLEQIAGRVGSPGEHDPEAVIDAMATWLSGLKSSERQALFAGLRSWLSDADPWRRLIAVQLGRRFRHRSLLIEATRLIRYDPPRTRTQDGGVDAFSDSARITIELMNASIALLGPVARGFLTDLTQRSGSTREERIIEISARAALCLLSTTVDIGCLRAVLAILRSWDDDRVLRSTIAWLAVVAPLAAIEAVLTTDELEMASTLGPQ